MASLKRNVKKNGEVVYRIQISLGYDPNTGKRIPKVLTFKPNQNATPKQQEKEAQKFAMEMEDKLKNGESYEGWELSFAQYADKWLEYMKTEITYADHYKEPVDDEVLETVKDVMTTFTYRKIEQKEFADLCRAIEATGKKDVIPKAYEVLLEKSGLQKEEFREKTEIEQPNGEAECDDSIIDDEIRRLLEDIPQEEPKPRKEIVSHKANNVTESNKTVDDLFATKSKGFAGFIGTLLGPFAFHWFYLGKWGRAVLYILILILTMNYDRAISEVFIRFCVLEGLTLFCCTKKFALRYIRNSFTTVWFYVLVVAAVFSPLLLQYV